MTTIRERKDLETVWVMASKLLAGQKDKAGEPLFQHAHEMAKELERLGHASTTIAPALLHDVFEDAELTGHRLFHLAEETDTGLSFLNWQEIVENVVVMSRRMNLDETYREYIGRVKRESAIATRVKIEDLRHHLTHNQSAISASLRKRYQKALAVLTS